MDRQAGRSTGRHAAAASLALLTGALTAPAVAANLDVPDRSAWIGPAVARTATFTAHVPDARSSAAGARCPAAFGSGQKVVTPEERKAAADRQYEYVRERHAKRYARYQQDMAAVTQRQRELTRQIARREISREEAQRRLDAIVAEQQALGAALNRDNERLNEEAKAAVPIPAPNVPLVVYVQHFAADPRATIFPLDGEVPAAAFDAALDAALAPFLATCGPLESIVVQHYYSTAARRGEAATPERPVLRYAYSLAGGRLKLLPRPPRSPDNPFTLATNQEITLAGFRAQYERIARAKGEYRADFEVASRRRPGIVYRYDAFWNRFPDFEIGRRIFDGDFENWVDTIDFAALYLHYGSFYTSRCRAHVRETARLYYPTRRHVGDEITPDLTFEPKYEEGMGYIEVDARFAPRMSEYMREMTKYMLQQFLGQQKSGARFDWTPQGLRSGVDQVHGWMKLGPTRAFFEAHDCTSATLQQLGENVHRAASRMPSVQSAGVHIANAERDSDPPRRP